MRPSNALAVSLLAGFVAFQAASAAPLTHDTPVVVAPAKDPPGITTAPGTEKNGNNNWFPTFPDLGHFQFEVSGPDGVLVRVIDDGTVECHDYGKTVNGDVAGVMMWKALCLATPRTWVHEEPRKPEQCRNDASGLIICGEKW